MHSGSCLCGGVRYQIEGEVSELIACHCSRCRKATGTAFATVLLTPVAGLRLLQGESLIREFESSPGVFRVFCSHCGSPLYSRRPSQPDVVKVRAGTLDTPLPGKIAQHIYVASKATWYELCDSAPRHAERP